MQSQGKKTAMWDPITYVLHERGYIYTNFGHCYVMRDGVNALNWQGLEAEAQRVVLSRQWSGDSSPYYPLTWDLLEKAEFARREQDKAQATYQIGDGEARFFAITLT